MLPALPQTANQNSPPLISGFLIVIIRIQPNIRNFWRAIDMIGVSGFHQF